MQSRSLEEANRQMRAVFDASRFVTIIATNVEGTITFFNKGAEEILGYSSDEVIGKETPAILHDKEEVKLRAAELTKELGYPIAGFETFVAYAKKGLYEEREWTYICKDGKRITVMLSVTPIYNAKNEIIGFLGTGVDITERKHFEEKLRESEELFRRLFEDSGDALLLLVDGIFVDCNEVTVEMLRADSKEQVLNTHPSDLSPEFQGDGRLSAEKAQEMINLAFQKGYHRFEWLHKRVDGEVFPVEVLLTAITMENKRVLHTCWRDITDRKEAEEKLRQSQKMEVIGQLAGGIAHDFNNMLSGIMGATELLQTINHASPQQKELFELITNSAQRASELTQQLLTFARKDTQNLSIFNMVDTLKSVKALLEHTIDKSIQITVESSDELLTVQGDKSQLENALMNLGINARDAMPNGGELRFSIKKKQFFSTKHFTGGFDLPPGTYVKIKIADTGQGIPPSLLLKIFEPFFTTKEQGKGTGLGLASVYGTIKSHNGAVDLKSTLGKGTVFSLYIPLYQFKNDATTEDEPRPLTPISTNHTILVIDDEDIVRIMLEIGLQKMGYKVLVAERAAEGIDLYKKNRDAIDLVVLDMIMPEMKGSDCFRELKKLNSTIKVIIASGYTRQENVEELIEEGLAGFIHKPFKIEQLSTLIQEILQK